MRQLGVGMRELQGSHSKAVVLQGLAASAASRHHRRKKWAVCRRDRREKMQHLAPVRLFRPDVAMNCNMEAIRGSLEFQEGADVASWRGQTDTQRSCISRAELIPLLHLATGEAPTRPQAS